MRKERAWYRNGDLRERTIFLWWPRTERHHMEGIKKTRWLERATIEERFWDSPSNFFKWSFTRFVND